MIFFEFQKVRNTLKPNIYECKICNEHHCEHDFPSDSLQELSPMFSTTPIILQPPPHQHSKSPTPQNQQRPCNSKQNGGTVEFPTTTKNIESDDKKSKN